MLMTTPLQENGLIGQVLLKLGEIGTDVAVIKEQTRQQANDVSDHELRLRRLETSKAKMAGACGALSVMVTVVGELIGHAVHP